MRAAVLLSLCIALAGCKPKDSAPPATPTPKEPTSPPHASNPQLSSLWTAKTGREFVDQQTSAVLAEDVPRFWASRSSEARRRMIAEAEKLLREGESSAQARSRIEWYFNLERPLRQFAPEALAHAILRFRIRQPENRQVLTSIGYRKEERSGATTEILVEDPEGRFLDYRLVLEDGVLRCDSVDLIPGTELAPLLRPEEQPKSLIPASARKARMKRVSDGDTIQTIDGEKIRYIGIDTPELSHQGKPEEPFAREAMEFNRNLIEGKDLYLETDAEPKDKYGRTLAYVWVRDGERDLMVNEEIVRAGFAYVYTLPPNVRHADTLLACQREARENQRGFWKDYKLGGETFYVATARGSAFHRPSCKDVENKHDLNKFKDQSEALDAGLHPCRNCKP